MTKGIKKAARTFALLVVLCATGGAWAATPTAEWCGTFPVDPYDNPDGVQSSKNGTCTISKNNSKNVSTAKGIKILSTEGGWPITVQPDSAMAGLTVVVGYRNPTSSSTGTIVGFSSNQASNGTKINANICSGGAIELGWGTEYNWSATHNNNTLNVTQPDDGDIHYVTLAYAGNATEGTTFWFDGANKKNITSLGSSGYTSVAEITLGAIRGPNNMLNGVEFVYVAVYSGVLSDADAATAYSSAKSKVDALVKYEKWSYAKALLTWTTSGNNELASSSAKYTLFDIDSGSDTGTVYNGAGTSYQLFGASASEVFWHYICDSGVGTVYSAPGVALRFSGDTAGKTIGGTFGPVAFGGIYVESGATGYSFTQTSGSKRDNIWGDPSNTVETWFTFEEPFEVNRAGSFFFAGTVNLDLPESSDVLTLQKNSTYTGNEGHNPVIVKTYTQQGNGVALSVNNATLGGTLKMHGAGHVDVTTLTANGATLDFSDIGSRYNDTTPFINGELVVNADTKFVFPDGISYPYTYKVAASISDGSTIPSTWTVDGNVYTGVVSADKANGTITIASLLSATAIEVNNDLTISGATAANITVNAGKTLTLESGAALSGTMIGSGTIVCNQVDLSGNGFDNASGWTGTVQIAGDAGFIPLTYFDESSYGNANSTLEIVSGQVYMSEATSLPGSVSVASGAVFYMASSSLTSLTISGTNNGQIHLSSASNLETLTLSEGITRGTIVYPTSLTTLNVARTEAIADDGRASYTCTGATLTGGTLTLTKPDGTTESVTGTADDATVSFAWTPSVSGAACWIDYEMEYESGVKTGFENTGTDTTNLSSDTISGTYTEITGSDAFTDHGMLYTYAHPYRTGLGTLPDNWTAVVRCTVPNYENAAVITFGWYDSMIGLVAGEDPETEMRLIRTTGDSAFETLATMTVENATTAQHVYIFSVETNQTIKVYCDGEQVLDRTFDPFTLTGGFQVGSALGGVHETGVVRFGKNESPANTLSETEQKDARIDCVRLYKGVLGPNAIRQLSVEFPAVKLFRATVAADAETTWDALSWTPAWDGGNDQSKIILTVEGDATLTLPSTITAEDFKIEVASGHVLTLNRPAGGTTITTTNPMEIDDGTMYLADDSSLGTWEIGGTGTVRLKDYAMVTGALSGTAKVEIPSGTTVAVTTGSIANTITGAGVLAYTTALPASALSFSSWTGTVQLPTIASGGINFNNYGVEGSTVYLTSMSGAWIDPDNTTIAPKLYLGGNMTLTAMSTRVYTFAEIDGTGNLSLATSEGEPTVVITKVAEGYSGTISSTLTTPVTIATLAREARTSTAYGTKLLTTSGNVKANGLTIGGETSNTPIRTRTDGIYVVAGTIFSVY